MTVLLPDTVTDACAMLRDTGATPIAGGTDLCVNWPANFDKEQRTYLDLSGIGELKCIEWKNDELVLGALTSYWDVIVDARIEAQFPLLVQAALQVGAVQIQTRGTWAGNIANGSPAADGVPVLMAYDAHVELTGAGGTRRVALDDYYSGYKKSCLQPEELITRIFVPIREYSHQVFEKVGPRRAQAITKVGVAVTADKQGQWRVVANSVAATVRRCRAVEKLIERAQPISAAQQLQNALLQDVQPIDDQRSTARYRQQVLARLLYYGLVGRLASFK